MSYTESSLCQLNGGCMGCCGHDFESKEKIVKAIQLNTIEFADYAPHTETSLIEFRDRAYNRTLRWGVCLNLIEKKGQWLCPLHPGQNNGKDLREGHCDINHLCKTAKEFSGWDEKKQKRFLEFIKSKKLNKADYSIMMDKSKLLEEFEK